MPAHILIVEDRPANQKLMKYLLERSGHQVSLADTGEEGIELAHREDFDLILCDIRMPGMEGYEVARRLKADPKCCHTPLIAITALGQNDDHGQMFEAGFDGYVAKAIAPQLFLKEVQGFLPSRELQPSAIESERFRDDDEQ